MRHPDPEPVGDMVAHDLMRQRRRAQRRVEAAVGEQLDGCRRAQLERPLALRSERVHVLRLVVGRHVDLRALQIAGARKLPEPVQRTLARLLSEESPGELVERLGAPLDEQFHDRHVALGDRHPAPRRRRRHSSSRGGHTDNSARSAELLPTSG